MTKTPGSKWAHGHARKPLDERFWAKVQKTDGCWLWLGATFRESGYGQIDVDGKKRRANRVAWELAYGEIDPGQVICHHCDNPSCVRPDHLFAGTQRQNVDDMVAKGRTNAKISRQDAEKLRSQYAEGGMTYATLAAMYEVTPSAVGKVIRGQSWKVA